MKLLIPLLILVASSCASRVPAGKDTAKPKVVVLTQKCTKVVDNVLAFSLLFKKKASEYWAEASCDLSKNKCDLMVADIDSPDIAKRGLERPATLEIEGDYVLVYNKDYEIRMSRKQLGETLKLYAGADRTPALASCL